MIQIHWSIAIFSKKINQGILRNKELQAFVWLITSLFLFPTSSSLQISYKFHQWTLPLWKASSWSWAYVVMWTEWMEMPQQTEDLQGTLHKWRHLKDNQDLSCVCINLSSYHAAFTPKSLAGASMHSGKSCSL